MPTQDERIDAYIEKAAPFAQPILRHLRKLIHKANPEVAETIKWGMPSFDYKGPYVSMAAFKTHAVFGFWKYKLLDDPDGHLGEVSAQGGEAMGNLGRITSKADLPPDKVLIGFLRQAKALNDADVKVPKPKKAAQPEAEMPDELEKALKKVKAAWEVWNAFPPSARKDYSTWVTEAKTDATRLKRIQTTVEWVAEGKKRHWKYQQGG